MTSDLQQAIAILERVRDRLLVTGDKRIKDREITEFLEKMKNERARSIGMPEL